MNQDSKNPPPPIPTNREERKARVQWLLDHMVWTYPVEVNMPLAGDECLGPFTGEVRIIYQGTLQECATFDFVYVDPITETIEDDESRNTAFRVWVEAGPWYDRASSGEPEPSEGWRHWNRWGSSHDTRLDCGASTMDDVLLELASRVEMFYNEDGTPKDE